MRFIGIDVAAERHVVASVDETCAVPLTPTPCTEDAEGYQTLLGLLGPATDTLVAMEATGHSWKNLFVALVAYGFAVALLNPLRTHRFAGEELQRTHTDALDALGIARFAAQKRPIPTRLPDTATEELRELVRYRDRLVQDFGDRRRQLHRLVDLGFPEFTRYVRDLGSELATAVLRTTPRPPPSRASRSGAWPASATTAATRSARRWPGACSRPPPARSGATTARPTGSRSATCARTWRSCAAGSGAWSGTSNACWTPTRSAPC